MLKKELQFCITDFVLECASAKDTRTVIEAFFLFLQSRLKPEQVQIERNEERVNEFSRRAVYETETDCHFFLLRLDKPLLFKASRVSMEMLSEYEVGATDQAVRAFCENHKINNELRGMSFTDDVTGLYNQRYLETVLDREFELYEKKRQSFSVLFLDLDYFKKINDQHGHLIGSRILFEVGEEIKRALRESDTTFRYGGDEFLMVLSNTGLKEASQIAERIRKQVEKKRFLAKEGLKIRLTASIGVATYPDHALTKTEILAAADAAMYGGKRHTKNTVVLANPAKRDHF